jgi:hypothetical protein
MLLLLFVIVNNVNSLGNYYYSSHRVHCPSGLVLSLTRKPWISQQKPTRSNADVVNFATQPRNTMHAEESKQGSADDRFIVVTGRHENDRAPNKVSNQVSMASNRN